MKIEHLPNFDCGISPLSNLILEKIDESLKIPDGMINKHKRLERVESIILVQLCIRRADNDILEYLKFDFVSPNDVQIPESSEKNEKIENIRKILCEEFGQQVANRVRFSLSENKIRSLKRPLK